MNNNDCIISIIIKYLYSKRFWDLLTKSSYFIFFSLFTFHFGIWDLYLSPCLFDQMGEIYNSPLYLYLYLYKIKDIELSFLIWGFNKLTTTFN